MFANERIDYLRISVTDRCNSRCIYCMPPEGAPSRPHGEVLKFEEIVRLAGILASLGINKIRLTGGEPLVRKGILELITLLSGIEGIEKLYLTTNGSLLKYYARELKSRGIDGLNVSLNTFREDRFRHISRGTGSFREVMDGIYKAKKAGFDSLKINVVVMKGVNDDEIPDFVDFASRNDIIVRFIEFMDITPMWDKRYFVPIEEIKRICCTKFGLDDAAYKSSGPSEYYNCKDALIGFIKTKIECCMECRRLRLTPTGELKLCLYEKRGLPLKELLRKGLNDNELKDIISLKLRVKNGTNFRHYEYSKFYMSNIGG